jgi:signal transduction histidine kinase
VKILAKSNDKKVALRVIDEGIGIPEEDVSSIGKKFFRAKNATAVAGTGIGIYLTKHFVEMHGGEIAIESEIGVGTSVTIILPKF